MSDPRVNRFLVAMSKEELEAINKKVASLAISKNEFFIRAALAYEE